MLPVLISPPQPNHRRSSKLALSGRGVKVRFRRRPAATCLRKVRSGQHSPLASNRLVIVTSTCIKDNCVSIWARVNWAGGRLW